MWKERQSDSREEIGLVTVFDRRNFEQTRGVSSGEAEEFSEIKG